MALTHEPSLLGVAGIPVSSNFRRMKDLCLPAKSVFDHYIQPRRLDTRRPMPPQPSAIAINHEVQIYPRGRQRRRVHVRRGIATRICSRWRLIRPHVVANECYTRMLAIVVSTILSGVGIHCFGRYQLIVQYTHTLFVLLTYQPYHSIEPF
jgi:hypothetical protein